MSRHRLIVFFSLSTVTGGFQFAYSRQNIIVRSELLNVNRNFADLRVYAFFINVFESI